MASAGLSRATAAAAMRRLRTPSASALTQQILAGEGILQKGKDCKSAPPTFWAPPQLLTGDLLSGVFGSPGYDCPVTGGLLSARSVFGPPSMPHPHRKYTTDSGPRLRTIPVRSIRPENCLDDRLLTLKESILKYPLFRKVKGHPLIPDSADAWLATEHGLAFFYSLGLLAKYNNELNVSVAGALTEDNIRVSPRFGFAEFVEHAQGMSCEDGFCDGEAFKSYGLFAQGIIQTHYPGADIPDINVYVQDMIHLSLHPSEDEVEYIVYNAALLSPDAAIAFIYRSDSWLRRRSRYQFRAQDGADSDTILHKYAAEVIGPNEERIWDRTSIDVLLRQSRKMKGMYRRNKRLHQKLLKSFSQLQGALSPGSPSSQLQGFSTWQKNASTTPGSPSFLPQGPNQQLHGPSSHQKHASGSPPSQLQGFAQQKHVSTTPSSPSFLPQGPNQQLHGPSSHQKHASGSPPSQLQGFAQQKHVSTTPSSHPFCRRVLTNSYTVHLLTISMLQALPLRRRFHLIIRSMLHSFKALP